MIIKNSYSNFLGIPNAELIIKNYGNIHEVKLNNTLILLPPALFTFLINFVEKADKQNYVNFKDEDWIYEIKTLQRYAKKNDICKENNVFLLPMIALDETVTGLEIRVPENYKGKFKFVCKTKGYAKDIEKCLSKINTPEEAKKAIICAGYKDGYAIYQYLKDLGQENEYQILTNTNGEPNTFRTLEPHIEYLQGFEQVILCLDNEPVNKP